MDCHFGKRGRGVAGVGPLHARVLLLGEAPGKDEEREGESFIGASGQFLWEGRDWTGQSAFCGLERMGLRRQDVRIENVIETRPPSDNSLLTLTPDQIAHWQRDFWERRFPKLQPTVIVPLGNLALNTLRRAPLPVTKKGTWRAKASPLGKQIDWRDKISNWRGSIFNATAENGTKVKVIPTYHPAFVLRAGDHYDVWRGDLERILGDQHFPDLRHDPKPTHLIDPTQKDAHAFRMLVHQAYVADPKHAVLAIDIETLAHGKVVDCIGFSVWEDLSLTVSMRAPWAWQFVTAMLQHPIAKGWHFGLYDRYVLGWTKGKVIVNSRWDSHQMHHLLDPRDDHDLGYCASRDLRTRYWKDESKEAGTGTVIRDSIKRLRYNGKDVALTRGLIERYRTRLRDGGLLKVYREHYRELTDECLTLTTNGFNVDDRVRRDIETREQGILVATREQMKEMAGTDLVAKKGLSGPKVCAYFYDHLKCKPYYRRGSGGRTADELAVRRLMRRYKKARPMGQLILDYRAHSKLLQEVRPGLVSQDGRMRSRYSPTAKTGRLRSTAVVKGQEGVNGQNRDRKSDLRRMFVADPKQILVEWDQSQGESRIVDGMSGDPELLTMARMLPTAIDQHVANACKVFGLDYTDLLAAYKAGDKDADEKRQLGKRVRHASNYGMEGKRMAEIAFIETEGRLVLDPDDCEEWLAKMKASTPGIELYQAWIRQQMIEEGKLTNSWGRTIYWKGLRLSKEDYKEGYAWLPQSEVGILTNRLALVALGQAIRHGKFPNVTIVNQSHDSLAASCPPKLAYRVAQFVVDSMGVERVYPGAGGSWSLAMPIGVKVGRNWKDMQEWKALPSRAVFEAAVMERMAA